MVNEERVPLIYEEDTGSVDTENERRRIHDLAKSTLRGDYGVGKARREALGEDYHAVSNEVSVIRSQAVAKSKSAKPAEDSDPIDYDYQEITEEELKDLAQVETPDGPTNYEGVEGYKE